MQPSSGGGGDLSRGLARFRSAPVTWLDALLESDEEGDPPKPSQSFAHLPPASSTAPSARRSGAVDFPASPDPAVFDSSGVAAASGMGFLRHNSSPAEFLAQINSSGSEGFFSGFDMPSNYDFLSPSVDASPSSKRPRERGEQSAQLRGGMTGLLDSDMEKLLEDSVPCRVRAKRGCATHPRSIAERVRRTKISDRIRKLQELVPNMDKQTNTADMLDEAVEYVKFLQRQIQELMEHQKNCKCINKD